MTAAPRCGKGWATRCSHSKGAQCRCKCGGANHGTGLRESVPLTRDGHANYSIVRSDARLILLRDQGPWDRHMTITNDASWVVAEFAESLLATGRRLFYYDSYGELTELKHEAGKFVGFGPATTTDLEVR